MKNWIQKKILREDESTNDTGQLTSSSPGALQSTAKILAVSTGCAQRRGQLMVGRDLAIEFSQQLKEIFKKLLNIEN